MAKTTTTRHYSPIQLQERAIKATATYLQTKGYKIIRADEGVRNRSEVIALKSGKLVGFTVRTSGKKTLDAGIAATHLQSLRGFGESNAIGGASTIAVGFVAIVTNPQSLNADVTITGTPIIEPLHRVPTQKTNNDPSISYEGLTGTGDDEPDFDIDGSDASLVCPTCREALSLTGACSCIG